jgi:hypothetical protein
MKIKFHSCQQEILASIPYIHTSVRIFADGDGELVSCTYHTFPGRGCQGPFNPVMGRGLEGNGRCRMEQVAWKYVECPLPEVLKHNKRTSAVQNMVKIPRFLKRRYRYGVTLSNF